MGGAIAGATKPKRGAAGSKPRPIANSFRFSGRLRSRALKPGKYRLVGRTGNTSKTAGFKIVR